MVTKHAETVYLTVVSYILAKNHMVTKHQYGNLFTAPCYILAKNHMVTKLWLPKCHE